MSGVRLDHEFILPLLYADYQLIIAEDKDGAA